MLFHTQDVPLALGVLARVGEGRYEIERVAVDSRSPRLGERDAFFCLVTQTGNGHRYIGEAYKRGVRCFVISEREPMCERLYPEALFLQVEDTLRSLQALARAHRESCTKARVVAITGSYGKTIVKEMLYTLLSPVLPKVYRSPASYNSQLGVALSLLAMPQDTELAFIEAGISAEGEMVHLREMIVPDDVLISHLGAAHQENFPTRQRLYQEKLGLYAGRGRIYTAMQSELASAMEELGMPSELVCSVGALPLEQALQVLPSLELLRNPIYRDNLALALGFIAEAYPEHLEEAMRYVPRLSPLPLRLEVKENSRGHILIYDSYSNDLSALSYALVALERYAGRALVLGELQGSGLSAEMLCREALKMLRASGLERVYLLGWDSSALSACASAGLDCRTADSVEGLLTQWREELLNEPALLIKGSRAQGLECLLQQLSLREHTTSLEVDLAALRTNLSYYRSRLPESAKLVAMIKADAYGLGALEVARCVEKTGQADYLAVAVADEGKALRQRGIDSPIIVLNPQADSLATLQRERLDAEVYSLDMLRLFGQSCAPHVRPRLHLKVDSGMHRLGFRLEELPELLSIIKEYDIRLTSVFSHLAGADEERLDAFTDTQAEYLHNFYHRLLAELELMGHDKPYLHLLNTAGLERLAPRYAFGGGRLGVGLYGFSPSGRSEVQPVARFVATILQVKTLAEGEAVGYSCRAVLECESRIAVLSVGYADGLHRRYGNGRWSVELDGVLCPIVGNVCMDSCMIDVTALPHAKAGDRVTIFGSALTPLEAMAEVGDTIPYEVLTSISPRVARIYINA